MEKKHKAAKMGFISRPAPTEAIDSNAMRCGLAIHNWKNVFSSGGRARGRINKSECNAKVNRRLLEKMHSRKWCAAYALQFDRIPGSQRQHTHT